MRQVNEGVRIACCEADICMNSKAEFHQPSIVRVTNSLGNSNEEQTGPLPVRGARSQGRSQRGRGQEPDRMGSQQPGGGAGWPSNLGASSLFQFIFLYLTNFVFGTPLQTWSPVEL